MRNINLFLAILSISVVAFTQSKKDDEVIAVAKQAIVAQENYDTATLEKLYASDYIEISPIGEIDEREKAIGFYKVADIEKEKARTPRYTLDDFKVRYYGKFAMVISKFSIGSKKDSQRPPSHKPLVASNRNTLRIVRFTLPTFAFHPNFSFD
jgi:ketosteroid isomerase-like protein